MDFILIIFIFFTSSFILNGTSQYSTYVFILTIYSFLKIGVWDLIHVWMKACKDNGSVSFLLILLKLLHILPMNIERLRENDCPKIVKKLCKHENKEVSHQSNLIIQKWTEIIKNSPVQNGTNAAIGSSVSKEKKRKSIDNGSSAVTGNDGSKKIKSNSSSVSAKANGSLSERGDGSLSRSNEGDTNQLLNDAEQYESFPRDEISNKLLNNNNSKETKARPVTVKVKQGKFRLDLSASSQKTSEKVKKKTFDVVKTDGVKPVGTEMKKLPILSRSSLTTNGTIKSLSPLSNNNSNNKNSHVLKVRNVQRLFKFFLLILIMCFFFSFLHRIIIMMDCPKHRILWALWMH